MRPREGRPQSFVAKHENSERRLDVIEAATVLEVNPVKVLRELVEE